MKTRMQPIGNVWNKCPASSATCRCSAASRSSSRWRAGHRARQDDHRGDQGPPDPPRPQRGRPRHRVARDAGRRRQARRAGTLVLRAYHEGGQVNIEIADDGGGIDPRRIRAKAVEQGRHHRRAGRADGRARGAEPHLRAGLLDRRAGDQRLRAAASAWTSSDQHREDRRHGRRQTELGVGTTFKVKIPLTLAIVPALIVTAAATGTPSRRSACSRAGPPRPARTRGRHRVGPRCPRLPAARRLLPIVDLASSSVASIRRRAAGRHQHRRPAAPTAEQFGLIVDGIHDTQEIVVKPLGRSSRMPPCSPARRSWATGGSP
jgi:two-component system, chemotaxis family, sensor kinase CheA